MIQINDGDKFSGKFEVGEHTLDGELTFSGGSTNLYVYNNETFRPDGFVNGCVHGRLRNSTHVSLIACIAPDRPSLSLSSQGRQHSATITPHYIVYGNSHLSSVDRSITGVKFKISDRFIIFDERGSFGLEIDIGNFLSTYHQFRGKKKLSKKTNGNECLVYFTGKLEIFRSKTCIGTIYARNSPIIAAPSAKGVSIDNEIYIHIDFYRPSIFSEAVRAILDLLQFFQIIAGRRQGIDSLTMVIGGKHGRSTELGVYWRHPPRRENVGSSDPHFSELPVNAPRHPRLFAKVLRSWLDRHQSWSVARGRFSESFSKERSFSVDRLIGSANMFDLLPASAVPANVHISDALKDERDRSRKKFKQLPQSNERDSILNALGRIGHASLKHKVRHLAHPVCLAFSNELPHFNSVLDMSVDARNYFVHGTDSKIDYSNNMFETVVFFTESLEFVFLISDLMLSGWNVQRWRSGNVMMFHPISRFVRDYRSNLKTLVDILPNGHSLKLRI